MTENEYKYFFIKSRNRMARLIQMNAPDVIIENEARILLKNAHCGAWKAIRHWIWRETRRRASNVWFDVRVFWYCALHNLTYDQAADLIVSAEEPKEEQR